MDKTEKAFRWIHSILADARIPFVFGGGFAARLYGATRPLYDIDLDIPEDRFIDLLPKVKDYVVSGPQRFQDELFDVYLLTLNYEGQPIDITGAESIRLYDVKERAWKPDPTDFSNVTTLKAYGLSISVAPKELLLRYKKWIARPTDLQDVAEIESFEK